jgi:hypothetical protein
MASNMNTHNLLLRDWFANEQEVIDLLDETPDDEMDIIYENRNLYSDRIRYIIEPNDFTKQPTKKMKIGYLSDSDMKIVHLQRLQNAKDEFERMWNLHNENIGERPYGTVDEEFDDAWDSLEFAKTKLTNYLSKNKTGYVPPSMRGAKKVDPVMKKLEDDIQTAENEFNARKARVEFEDKVWLESKKNEFRNKQMYQLS